MSTGRTAWKREIRRLKKDGLDTEAFAPAYYQLARILREKIMSGELRPGDRIPSEEALGKKYGLSRMTARKAISLLTEEGLVRGERGRGTFVIEPKVDGGVFLIPDFHEKMRTQGISTQVRLIGVNVVKAGKVPAQKLGIRRGKQVLYLKRILEGDGEPLVLDRKYMLYDKTQPLLEAELGHGSTTELFSGWPGLRPVRAELNLSATVLTPGEAKLLDRQAGAPAFCMEQLIYAANDLRVIWGWLIYRGDRFSFASLSRPL
jgi:GntR family transcriptional regulator